MGEKFSNQTPEKALESSKGTLVSSTQGLFRAGVAAALISSAGVTMAQENTSLEQAYNNWCEQNKELCSKYNVQQELVMDNYDSKTNTLFIPVKTKKPSKINQKNFQEFLSLFDVDSSGNISTRDVEIKFGINIGEFTSLYSGSTLFIELQPEISKLLDTYQILIAKRNLAQSEEQAKKIDKEIFSLLKEIDRKKTKYYIDYFDTLTKNINEVLSDGAKKVLFLSFIANNPDLKEFSQFVISNISQPSSDTVGKYSDLTYISEELSSKLASDESEVPENAFTKQERLTYQLGFIRLKDVYNAQMIASQLQESNVFDFLSDINGDGHISKDDKGVLFGAQIRSLLLDLEKQLKVDGNEEQLYANIGFLLTQVGVTQKIQSKAQLFEALQKNPLLKLKFQEAITYFNLAGVDMAYVLKYGPEGVKIWNETKQQVYNHPMVGKLLIKMKDKIGSLEQDLSKLKSSGLITDKDYLEMVKVIETTIVKPGFEERMFQQVVGMLSALSATYFSETTSLNGAKFSYSKNIFNAQNEKLLKKFVDKLELDLGVVNTQGGNMLMLGLAYKVDQSLSESEKLSYGFGARFGIGSINNVLPVLTLGYTKVTNLDELKDAGIESFDLTKNSFTGSLNYSMLNVNGMNLGAFAGYKTDRQGALETKFSEYSTLLDGVFHYEGQTLEQFGELLEKRVNTQEFRKVNFVANSILDIVNTLEVSGFDTLSPATKKLNLQIVKMQLLSKFLSYYASKEEEKGYGISGFGLSLNILMKAATGMPLLPGIEFSKMTYEYNIDQSKKTFSHVMDHSVSGHKINHISQTTLLTQLDTYLGVAGVEVVYKNGLIFLQGGNNENIFDYLEKAGVHVFLSPSEEVTSEIGIENNALVIGDVKNISVFIDSSKDGKRVLLLLGASTLQNTLKLTKESTQILGENTPTQIEEMSFSHRNISLQNTGNLHTKKIGIFM